MRTTWVRVYVGLAWLYLLATAVQFLLAGLGLLGGEDMQAHKDFGYMAVHLSPILLLIVSLIAKLPRNLILMTLVLAIVVFVQPIWVTEFRGEFLGSFHILGAMVIVVLAHDLAQRATRVARDRREAARI